MIFTQKTVNDVKVRVVWNMLKSMVQHDLPAYGIKHLWFPYPNDTAYSMRDGNPPPDSERPKHLRKKDLIIDIGHVFDDSKDNIRDIISASAELEEKRKQGEDVEALEEAIAKAAAYEVCKCLCMTTLGKNPQPPKILRMNTDVSLH